MKRLARVAEALAWFAFFLFAAAILALRFWVLPDIERHREDIVAALSRGIGLPVRIGAIEAGWMGLRPKISLSDVRIYDAQGREALVLPAVDNVVAWRSLARGELRLHSLVIDSPRLAVRRDADGALYVAGLKLGGGGGDAGSSDWIFDHGEIVIRNAELEWRDERRGAPPLALSGLELRLSSSGGRLALGLKARPPARLGTSVELRALLAGRRLEAEAWSGRVYVELGYTDLAAWRPWVDYPLGLREGQGALRAWMTVEQGKVKEGTTDVALAGVRASLGDELDPLELASVRGRVSGRVLEDGVDLSGRGLAVVPERGPEVPQTDFQIVWRPGKGGTVGASVVDLEGTGRLLESLPLPPQIRLTLAELALRGRLSGLRLEWTGPFDAPARYSARARFAGLAMQPRGSVPGFAGLSGSVEASEAGGRLQLAAKGAVLELPQVLAEPQLALDALAGEISWEQAANGVAVRVASLSFANAHLGGSLQGSYARSGEGPGTLDLTATLPRADGSAIRHYLPASPILSDGTRAWLARAIAGGEASDLRVRIKGDLRDFPFVDPASGQFEVSARIDKGVLDPAEGWPRIRDIAGELRFARDGMEIAGSASILGARAANVRVRIPKFSDPHVLVSGQADGPQGEFLKYIASSPVREMTAGATSGMQASGRGRLRLKLDLPLDALDKTRVAGDFEFSGGELKPHVALEPIERAAGRLSFSDAGFTLHELRGRQFGGPVTVSGGSRAGVVDIAMRGEATVAALRELFDHPAAKSLSGSFAYASTVSIKDGLVRARLESQLRGVESTLPPPLAKRAADALPLRIELTPAAGGERDRISVELGELVRAEVARRKQGGAMVAQRTALWVSPEGDEAIRLPERPGTLVYGSLPAFDLDRWLPLFGGGGEEFAQAVALELKFGTLDGFGRRLTKVALRASAEAAGWSANVSAAELGGDVSFRNEGGGKLLARLAHFTIPADAPGAKPQPGARPGELPAVDLVAEEFTFRGKRLGRVELVGSRDGDDWRIERASMINPDASLTGHGLWRGAPLRTEVELVLSAGDIGAFLERAGYPGMVKGGKAELQASLAWNGDPGSLDFPTLGGEIELQAEGGQFLEIDPGGVGKLLSLMSLQALPKRITLDFRDVFSQGFQFDQIKSAARVERGVLGLKEMRMRGSAADVEMSGQVDLARETQNLKVRVVPSYALGDGAALGIGLVNPVAGIAAALAQRLLKNPLGQLFAYDYAVSGSWADPRVEKVVAPQRPLTPQEARE